VDLTAQVVAAPDGRTLMCSEWGETSGVPVVLLHGTPGCRLAHHPSEDMVRSLGVRLVTYDRPGYGGSDRHRGRRVVECASDVLAIADRLGLGRYAVWGVSGGGPHALAVAARLADSVTRVLCTGGVAPYDALGDAWFDGMDPKSVQEFHWAALGEDRLAQELRQEDHRVRQAVLEDPGGILDSFESLSDSDRRVLARPDFADVIRRVTFEQTRNGVWGWVDDDLAFTLPWGFDPASIVVPARIEYGMADVLVPPSHGEWLAGRMPAAEVRVHPLGRLGDPDADLVEQLGWLTEGTAAGS
jgi:pimeloyl-ACP methyl ester carboxylesterase